MSHREPHAATEPCTGAVMGMRGCEGAPAPGEPVAIHALYGVLARGRQRFSVADA